MNYLPISTVCSPGLACCVDLSGPESFDYGTNLLTMFSDIHKGDLKLLALL